MRILTRVASRTRAGIQRGPWSIIGGVRSHRYRPRSANTSGLTVIDHACVVDLIAGTFLLLLSVAGLPGVWK